MTERGSSSTTRIGRRRARTQKLRGAATLAAPEMAAALAAAEEAKVKAQQRLEEGGDISEDEAKALAAAILYSEAQLKAKRHRR